MFRLNKLLIALLACCVLQSALADERILSFHSDIQVAVDSSMQATETIRVQAEGEQIKRGIYRDFPTDYRDHMQNRIQVGFEVLNVSRDGRSENYSPSGIPMVCAFTLVTEIAICRVANTNMPSPTAPPVSLAILMTTMSSTGM